MTPLVVIDTNVVVAGLLTSDAASPVAAVLDGMLAADFPFAVSVSLLAVYRGVLNRPALCKAHGLSPEEVEDLVLALAEPAIVLSPVSGPAAPDPGDQHLWDRLAARPDSCLVTGDKRLLEHHANPFRVITPQAFVDGWASGRAKP